ncbi:hypothetical protein QYE76_008163 [Lolium multiflorum]|uniref:Ribonuclease H1 N-terminal domain-containing protein n=1 Tax=Lolium multiflorum TaxID=4521 RepID=A0AAD8PI82_LOLMU|nr:hypothetical protein QYE76_008163 [Lolium multiflorum]
MGILAVTTGEASPGTHAARLLCLSGSSTSVETGVLAVEQKVDTNVVYPAEDVHGVAGHHGEVFLGPMLDANLDPFDDFGPNVQFQEDVEGDDEEMPTTYVVYKGRVPGVYDDWEDCRRQVHRFSGNSYKGYPTRVEAEGRYARYLAGEMRDMRRNRMKTMAFVMMVIVTMLVMFYVIVV